MNRRKFGKLLGSGLAYAGVPYTAIRANQRNGSLTRPNIIFISSDNQSFKDTGFAGHPLIQTPNLNRIANQGTFFSNAYCGSPVCAPGRACMMTGMYPSDNNSYCNATPWDGSYPTWGYYLRESGYHTQSIGKLDLNGSKDTGFIEIESSHGHVKNPDITALFRIPLCYRMGERPNVTGGPRESRHRDASWTNMAINFIKNDAKTLNKPWALNIGFRQPHVAFFERKGFLAYEEYWDKYPLNDIDLPDVSSDELENQHLVFQSLRQFKRLTTLLPPDRIRRALAGYYGMISELDEYVGKIWQTLEETDQLKNTIFIYTSDNGMCMGEHGLFYHNNLYEEAAKVPLVIAGPDIPVGERIDSPVSHVDLIATIFDLTGIKFPTAKRGQSLRQLMLKGNSGPEYIYSENHSEGNCTGSFIIRKGKWKYIHFTWYKDLLFNLAEDPHEYYNLANDPAMESIKNLLRELLYDTVNPDAITRRAFKKQRGILENMVQHSSEEELYKRFEFRLGPGQARALAEKYKRI